MATVDDVQNNFNQLFIKQIEDKLLDGSAAYLSFIATLAGVECLGCFFGGVTKDAHGGLVWDNKALFKNVVAAFFPTPYQSVDLWGLRNSLVHRFIPEEGFHLTDNQPSFHFKRDGGLVCLNAESLFADFKTAATAYFQKVRDDPAIGKRFYDVCKEVGLLDPNAVMILASNSNRGTAHTSMATFSPPPPPGP